MEKICKIVCFDEDSVTDYVQIIAGGKLETTEELFSADKSDVSGSAQASGQFGIKGVFKALLGWEAGVFGNTSAGRSLNSEKMVTNIVKNTILTDFLKIYEDNQNEGSIKKFENYKINIIEDSLSYIVMISPYLNMVKTDSSIPAGELNIAVDKLDNALRNAKGYYELIGTDKKQKVVLRFNINSFRNGYTIRDLLKMDLSIYAIKVGKTTLDNLNINNELGINISTIKKDNPSYDSTKAHKIIEQNTKDYLEVFDVLLAGVKAND